MSQISPEKPSIASNPAASANFVQRRFPWLYAFWKFSRPHTIIGTSLSVVGLSLIAWGENALAASWFELLRLVLGALLACLCGNVYIVGLNQLEDIAIDQVNKPHLPLASGEFSLRQGRTIVGLTGLTALLLSAVQGPFLMATVWSSLLIGTAYSLPPIRLKRFPFWAALCIFSVRGAIVNLGLFLHFNQQLSSNVYIPITVVALTLFVIIFTFVIAIFKDIPDIEGDRRYRISTLTIRLGAQNVFSLSRWVLTVCYVGMIVAAPWLTGANLTVLVVTHLTALIWLWQRSLNVNLQEKAEVARFYQFIWKLFFLEYLMFPIACLWRS